MSMTVDDHNSKRPLCVEGEDGEDRISSLPHELKSHIITHLPFLDAVRTCILSKRWKNVFSSLPILAFFQHYFLLIPDGTNRFQRFIDWILSNRDDSSIYTIAIHYNIHEQFRYTLQNKWIDFAVERNVRHLQLIAQIDEAGLPSSLFTCKTLVSLKLMARAQQLILPPTIYFPNLKDICLANLYFPNDTLTEAFFKGCPQLVSLYIGKCGVVCLRSLRISSPKLQRLWISNCSGMDTCIVNLEGTCLEFFYYDGTLPQSFEFGTMKCLWCVAMNITRNLEEWRSDNELAQAAWSVLRGSTHAKELSLSVSFIKVLSEVRDELWRLSNFTNMRNVRLYVWPSMEIEQTVMSLLGKFNHLRKLVMIIHRPEGFDDLLHLSMHPENYNLEGVLAHMDHLQIDYFEGCELDMGLLKYFLQNANSLTQVTLRTRGMILRHYHGLQSEGLRQEITDELTQLSDSHPTITITVFDVIVNHVID